jgi:hypothetical protein
MAETTERNKVIKYIELSLGGGMVDVELDKEHYDMAVDKALAKFRQRSSRAVEESFLVLTMQAGTSQYTLPNEVIDVKQVYRRNMGGGSSMSTTSANTGFDPFEAAYLNMYVLNAMSGSTPGNLVTYELFADYQKLLGTMFGAYINFTWSSATKNLLLHRNIRYTEDVILHTYNYKPDEILLGDVQAGVWLKDYSLATAKLALGQARSKFGNLAGPQGGVTLNGNDLLAQATSEIEKLEDDLKTYTEGGTPLGFIFG